MRANDGALRLLNIRETLLDMPDMAKLAQQEDLSHPPRILPLYGSLRERSRCRCGRRARSGAAPSDMGLSRP